MSNQQLEKPQQEHATIGTVRKLLHQFEGRIKEMLPRHMTPERMLRLAVMATSKTPSLLKVDPMSIVASVVQAARMGIEPDGTHNGGWLIPRWNKKTKRNECSFQLGWGGKIELQMRTGLYEEITPRAVYEKDEFQYGWNPRLEFLHRPFKGKDRGPLVAVYTTTVSKSGHVMVDVMLRHECEEIRDQFGPRNDADKLVGPWISDFDQMCLKTSVIRASKTKQMSVEDRRYEEETRQIEQDGSSPSEVILDLPGMPEITESDEMAVTTRQATENLKERIQEAKDKPVEDAKKAPKPPKAKEEPKPAETKPTPAPEQKPKEEAEKPQEQGNAPSDEEAPPPRKAVDWD